MPHWLPKALALATALSLHAALGLVFPDQPQKAAKKNPFEVSLYKTKKDKVEKPPVQIPEIQEPPPPVRKKTVKIKKAIVLPEPATPTKEEQLPTQKSERPMAEEQQAFGIAKTNAPTAETLAPVIAIGNTLETDKSNILPADKVTPPRGGSKSPKVVMAQTLSKLPVPHGPCLITFPPEAEELGLEGDVVLSLDIDEKGRVTKVKLSKSLSPILDKAAIRGIKSCRFTPATSGGENVSVIGLTYRYSFILD